MPASNALGEFLRARRGRLRPGQAGLPGSTNRRRTPGLRREELAALAGLSIDYYIRLEQGRERNPSPAIVNALAEVLQLDPDERTHLRALTHHAAGRATAHPSSPHAVSASIRGLLDRLRPCPALVLARNGDVVTANPEGLGIYAGLDRWPVARRNTIRWVFTHPDARDVLGDWHEAAVTCTANLRSRLAEDPDADDLQQIVDKLTQTSPEFAALWARHDVRPRRSATEVFHHPGVGPLTLAHDTLHLEDPTLRLSLYQPFSMNDAHVLALIAVDADLSLHNER